MYSTGFSTGGLTVQGGSYGGYSGSNLDGFFCAPGNPDACGDFTDTTANLAAAETYAGRYNKTAVPKIDEYVGVYIQAPGVAGVNLAATSTDVSGIQITGQTKMNFTFNQNPEWFGGANNKFVVLLTLGKGHTANCRIKLAQVVTPTAVTATAYSVNLSDFSVIQNCGNTALGTSQAALAAGPISQIDFQGDGGGSAITANGVTSGSNLTVAVDGLIPTTVVVKGGINFQ